MVIMTDLLGYVVAMHSTNIDITKHVFETVGVFLVIAFYKNYRDEC